METLKAIHARKSVRSYTGEDISEKELEDILSAAYTAPVGMGKYETIKLHVIKNKFFLDKLDAAAAKFFGDPTMHPLYGAPTLVVVSSQMGDGDNAVAVSNCACIVENMSIEAVELGVGTVHIWGAIGALNQNPELLAELKLPEGFKPVCAIALGKTTEEYAFRGVDTERFETIKMY